MKKPIPFYDGTMRQWKAKKRKEFHNFIRAYNEFRLGCAYTPVYPRHADKLENILKDVQRSLSTKEWGS